MRVSRFAGVSDNSREAVKPLSLSDLMTFDFMPAASEDDERVAAERARSIGVSLPFVAASHLIWSMALLNALVRTGADSLVIPVAFLLAGALLLDGAFWLLLRRSRERPYRIVRLTGLYGAATAALWITAMILVVPSPAGAATLTKAAMIAGIGASIPAFFTVPGLLMLSCAGTLVGVGLLRTEEPVLPIGVSLALFFVWLGIARARDLVFNAQSHLAAEWEAQKARRFLADFEESGRGWFWETNAEGALTYASETLARNLGLTVAAVVGRPFEDLLIDDSQEGSEEARRTLGFHLGARFPFADASVRAPGDEEVWWSISGSPNFDDYGRFLGFRGIGSNLSEQRRTEAETTKLARYDSLTGLPNRAMMRRTLDEALANAAERRRGCALMMIDLDRFKQVNDTLGHPVGDKLLRKVAGRLSAVVGEEGQVGRLGGDEFEAILPGIEEEGRLSALARRMIDEVSRPYNIEGHRVVIGTSVGIAIALPGRASAEGLIKDADLALYAAKADGRGTYRFYAPQMHRQANDRQALEKDLREALGRDELRLLFQPEVDTVTEEVVAFEALLRWHHPARGVLEPASFLAIAEECGLMPRIGEWVIRTACAEAAGWPDHVRVSVNLSPSQFADSALMTTVTGALASSALDPDRLELEITEDVFLADREASARLLGSLKGLGVRIALDNFGTGHSGLGHLRDAPLDKIKIDQSFVRGAAAAGSRNAAIVRAIVVLAESLGMDTTAEGAETLDELTLIRSLGCNQVQGFIFARPMPADEALERAAASKPPAEAGANSRPPRQSLIRVATLHSGGAAYAVRLRNISSGGAMIECERAIPPGTRVQLDLEEGGLLDAEVRWGQRGQIGLRFEEPFELRKLGRRRKPAAPAVNMLTPQYLEPAPGPRPDATPSPLAARRARS
jgi:diguanylate cyclase (GGDEF)-like protein/PAS domain S-box-containing protein